MRISGPTLSLCAAMLLLSPAIAQAAACTDGVPAPTVSTKMSVALGRAAHFDISVKNNGSQSHDMKVVVDIQTTAGVEALHVEAQNLPYAAGQARVIPIQANLPVTNNTIKGYNALVGVYDASSCQRLSYKAVIFSYGSTLEECSDGQTCSFH